MLLAFSKSNDSPCFVKIAIFSQKNPPTIGGGILLAQKEGFELCPHMPVACA